MHHRPFHLCRLLLFTNDECIEKTNNNNKKYTVNKQIRRLNFMMYCLPHWQLNTRIEND